MRVSRYEQETIINYNEEEKTAGVYTHNKSLIRKLEKLAIDRPDDCRLEKVSHDGHSASYVIPKSWVKITPTRILSEEQRTALAERAKAYLSSKSPILTEDSEVE